MPLDIFGMREPTLDTPSTILARKMHRRNDIANIPSLRRLYADALGKLNHWTRKFVNAQVSVCCVLFHDVRMIPNS